MESESLSLEALRQIDHICDTFEAAWKAGFSPRIEDYLDITSLARPWLLARELLAREIELRKRAGETPRAEDYAGRFEEFDGLVLTILNEPERSEETASLDIQSTQGDADVPPGEEPEPTESLTRLTEVEEGASKASDVPPAPALPRRIDRYQPIRLLGQGNFQVYLAVDEADGREVAIKLARPDKPVGRRRLMSLAEEAQRLAAVDHPNIVKVLAFVAPGEPSDGGPFRDGFIVLEYVAGRTMESLLRRERLSPARLARMLAAVADALHHAHTFGLVHRDLKPSNILIDLQDSPRVCDFGLAVHEEIQCLRRGEVAGTLHYMAPEQVRGETNRMDGRTDIWAIGVILYRGLTGRLPFRGNTTAECFEEILRCEPRPPRQFGDTVPRELERICLRCLSRQMSDRYLTAADLADELKGWLARASGEVAAEPATPLVLPKGFRSYDGADAAFFLSLLPGPRESDGLPVSVRFWKSRIESARGDRAFGVGLLYGLSGGGKSSFVRAGLIPKLDPQRVRTILLNATPTGTEARLLAELRRVAPLLPGDCDLAEAVALLRDEPSLQPREKLLIILDQLEQWLQCNPIDPDAPLLRALRQCEGIHVQALLLVRDDFWMATTRLFRTLDVPLVEGINAMAVELFDGRHARKVLENFGRALGQLPAGEIPPESEPDRFLAEAVSGLLGQDGRVIPVRLSLFVEVMRNRPWTVQNLQALGGMEGIGETFLEEVFDSPAAPPSHRLHRTAAEAVLRQLIPQPGAVLRCAPRTESALRAASGYAERSRDFNELIHVLDHELRLITPVERHALEGDADANNGPSSAASDERRYQLAHDYLIRPIRHWLERHLRGTREGRARLRLEAVASAWSHHPGAHRLPSFLEYLGILLHTRSSDWNLQEQQAMRAAWWHFLRRICVLAVAVVALVLGARGLLHWREEQELLNTALAAEDRQLSALMTRLEPFQDHVIEAMQVHEASTGKEVHKREVAGILLFQFAPTQARGEYLLHLLLGPTDPERVALVCHCLAAHPRFAMIETLRELVANERTEPADRLRAACALASLPAMRVEDLEGAIPAITSALLQEPSRKLPDWLHLLGRSQDRLLEPLKKICADPDAHEATRTTAAEAVAEILRRDGDTEALAALAVNSLPDSSGILLQELVREGATAPAIAYFHQVLAQQIENQPDELARTRLAERLSQAAIGLEALGVSGAVSALLKDQSDPRVFAFLVQRQAAFGRTRPHQIEKLTSPEVIALERQAFLQMCIETPAANLASVRAHLLGIVKGIFRDDPDPGVHSASELLLRRVGGEDVVAEAEKALRIDPPKPGTRGWLIGPDGHTFTIVQGPVTFAMGSQDARDQSPIQPPSHFRKIPRTFAISTREVTIAQYQVFDPSAGPDNHFTHEPRCPMNGRNWYSAAWYCNRLSEKAGIPRDQWCYPEPVVPGMTLAEGAVDRLGYRLPTEAEWEYACRAGTSTTRYFGTTETLLPQYAWTWLNSGDKALPVGRLLPNTLGMFDTLGNVWEWCHDGPASGRDLSLYPTGTTPDQPALDHVPGGVIRDHVYRILRGGAFDYSPAQACAAYRYAVSSEYGEGTFGFRVARTLPPAGK